MLPGLSFNRPKVPRHKSVCDPDAKRSYLEEAHQFAVSLAEGLGEQDGLLHVAVFVDFLFLSGWLMYIVIVN